MAWRKMKPETIERRRKEFRAERAKATADLRRRLAEKAKAENDPAGFWAVLLAEYDANPHMGARAAVEKAEAVIARATAGT